MKQRCRSFLACPNMTRGGSKDEIDRPRYVANACTFSNQDNKSAMTLSVLGTCMTCKVMPCFRRRETANFRRSL
jgi:hypothetical protein